MIGFSQLTVAAAAASSLSQNIVSSTWQSRFARSRSAPTVMSRFDSVMGKHTRSAKLHQASVQRIASPAQVSMVAIGLVETSVAPAFSRRKCRVTCRHRSELSTGRPPQ